VTRPEREQITRALDAFWTEIAKDFPKVKTGDLDPASVMRLEDAAMLAVNSWLDQNQPSREYDVTIGITQRHTITYRVAAPDPVTAEQLVSDMGDDLIEDRRTFVRATQPETDSDVYVVDVQHATTTTED
jgi:hypothetical protein